MARRHRVLGVLGFYVLGFIIFVIIYLFVIRPGHQSWPGREQALS